MTSGAADRVTIGRGVDLPTVDPSAAALAANARLEELRRAAGIFTSQPAADDLDQWVSYERARRARIADKKAAAVEARRAATARFWASMATDRTAEKSAAPAPVDPRPVTTAAPVDLYEEGQRLRLARLKETNPRHYYLETLPELPDHVRAYPSLLAAARRAGRVPHMRLYLLCRALDPTGSGYVSLDQVKRYYTLEDSPYRVFTPRRLRQILAAGAGVFWDRHTDSALWLKSPDKIAAALDVDHIAGAPVALPVWPLIEGHQATAAAFYAAWHAARGDEANPISRLTIRKLTGACKTSQINYEATAEIQARRNIAIVADATKDNIQEAAWRYGHVFKFRDHAGKLGRRGWVYVAANLPSSYQSPYATLPKGRQRRINTALHNLVSMGRGKGDDTIQRIYHGDGATAADAYNRDPKHDHYFKHGAGLKPTAARPPKLEGVGLWTVLQGQL